MIQRRQLEDAIRDALTAHREDDPLDAGWLGQGIDVDVTAVADSLIVRGLTATPHDVFAAHNHEPADELVAAPTAA